MTAFTGRKTGTGTGPGGVRGGPVRPPGRRGVLAAIRSAMARQEHLWQSYLDSFGASGVEARSRLAARSAQERDLERTYNAPSITDRRRMPPAPARERTDPTA